jgi:hypothetical protein
VLGVAKEIQKATSPLSAEQLEELAQAEGIR